MKTTKNKLTIYNKQLANCLLPIANCLLPIANCLLLIACCLLPTAFGQTKQATIELAFSETDSSQIITATASQLTDSGKIPIPDVEIHFYVQRLFGLLPVKSSFGNYTDEKGMTNAEILKKDNLGGDAEGNLTIIARIEKDDNYGTVETKIVAKIGKPILANTENFPRDLWAPSAPIALIASFGGLVGLVWITYFYVLFLTAKIRKAGSVNADLM